MSVFEPGVHRWIELLGQVRDVVRQNLVAGHLREALAMLPPGPKRVLDVGCGQGTQALLLAREGHRVVGLDPSEEMLDRFAEALADERADVRERVDLVHGLGEAAADLTTGRFDLVLCHGVLMYLERDDEMLSALNAVRAEHGMLSLLVRNGLALAMRPGLLGQWDQVPPALAAHGYRNRLGISARAHLPEELDAVLGCLGLRRRAWWGVRVFSDHLSGAAPEGDALAHLLRAEAEVAGRDPYRQVAALSHLLYAR